MDNKEVKLLKELKYMLDPFILMEHIANQAICIINFIPASKARFEHIHQVDNPDYWSSKSEWADWRTSKLEAKLKELDKTLSNYDKTIAAYSAKFDRLENLQVKSDKQYNELRILAKQIKEILDRKDQIVSNRNNVKNEINDIYNKFKSTFPEQKLDYEEEFGSTIAVHFIDISMQKGAKYRGSRHYDDEFDINLRNKMAWQWLKSFDSNKIDISKDVEYAKYPNMPEKFKPLFRALSSSAPKEAVHARQILRAEYDRWAEENTQSQAIAMGYLPLGVAPQNIVDSMIKNTFKPFNVEYKKDERTSEGEVGGRRQFIKGHDLALTIYYDLNYKFDDSGNPTLSADNAADDQQKAFHNRITKMFNAGPEWMDIYTPTEFEQFGKWIVFGKIEDLEAGLITPAKEEAQNKIVRLLAGDLSMFYEQAEEAIFNLKSNSETDRELGYEIANRLWKSAIAVISNILMVLHKRGKLNVSSDKIDNRVLNNKIENLVKRKPGFSALDLEKLRVPEIKALFGHENSMFPVMIKKLKESDVTDISSTLGLKENKYSINDILYESDELYKKEAKPSDVAIWNAAGNDDGITKDDIVKIMPEPAKNDVDSALHRMEKYGYVIKKNGKYYTNKGVQLPNNADQQQNQAELAKQQMNNSAQRWTNNANI